MDGKGKGYDSSSSDSGKGKGYVPPEDHPCNGALEALVGDIRVVGTGVSVGGGEGTRLLFSDNTLLVDDVVSGLASGICTVLGMTEAGPSIHCEVTIDVDNLGTITHQGKVDNLVIIGGTGCYEGIVGSVTAELSENSTDPDPETGVFEWELLLGVDARL